MDWILIFYMWSDAVRVGSGDDLDLLPVSDAVHIGIGVTPYVLVVELILIFYL
jgi:hypothetical protein